MANYATASNRWTEESLAELPVEGMFRLRGLEVTRLDTFVDAAFAFVLTILVISFDHIPSNYAEMLETIKRIPSFLVSFAVLMIFWLGHRSWSRRYGLENSMTLVISLSIIFTILVYVYPLRMVFESAFSYTSNGYFSSTFTLESVDELRGMFTYYSAGFLAMATLFASLYSVTLRSQDSLALSEREILSTQKAVSAWLVCCFTAIVSILIANLIVGDLVPIAGWMYALTYPLIWGVDRVLHARSGLT